MNKYITLFISIKKIKELISQGGLDGILDDDESLVSTSGDSSSYEGKILKFKSLANWIINAVESVFQIIKDDDLDHDPRRQNHRQQQQLINKNELIVNNNEIKAKSPSGVDIGDATYVNGYGKNIFK